MAYLRIFDPDTGVRETPLRQERIMIGRQPGVEILLQQGNVSRIHAVIYASGSGHALEDANSMAGTTMNERKVTRSPLRHGDTFQICSYVLEYRTDDDANETRLNVEGDNAVDQAMRHNFRVLPSQMSLRYRQISSKPTDLFETGDTLNIGGGGVFVPAAQPLDGATVLELEITWPGGKTMTLLGEVMATLKSRKNPGMCVKLHNLEGERYRHVMLTAKRGSWVIVSQ